MGLACVAMFIIGISRQVSTGTRVVLLSFVTVGMYVAIETDSIQGPIAFVAGLALFLLMKTLMAGWRIFLPTFLLALFAAILLILSLLNRGPLASLVYQVTIVFRADYMNAGVKMLFHNPFFGVGIDSYDDWYRAERGVISAFRTSFNRTANTAHNIALDLGSGGGWPLLLAYLSLNLLVVFSVWTSYKKGLFHSPFYCAATCAWFAYQVQAQVSINQIGVGIWGWVLAGIVIGYSKINVDSFKVKNCKYYFWKELLVRNSKSSRVEISRVPASASLAGAIFMIVGFTLAFLPFRADFQARQAINSGDLSKMLSLSNDPTVSSFFLTQVSQIAANNNFPNESKAVSEILIRRYPRNFYAWTQRLQAPLYSDLERNSAKARIRELDPNAYLCLLPNVPDNIVGFLSDLPTTQQRELLGGWSIVTPSGFANLDSNSLALVRQKIAGMCA